ncbi:MAG: transporter substrate-binding domain-containing protein [Spirochaetia bacterium]|nr:transporter substrate-binding domain-containing protein [Spirochaetia bacterium]
MKNINKKYRSRKLYGLWLLFILATFALDGQIKESRYFQILKNQKIRIGMSVDYPPLKFEKEGKNIGIEIDMASSLAEFLGVNTEIVPLSVKEYTSAIETNKVDVILGGMSRNLERGKKIWFSEPYLSITPAVFVNKRRLPKTKFGEEFEEIPYKTIWDIKKLAAFTFAVKEGSAYQSLIRSEFDKHKVIVVNSNKEGFEAVFSGSAHGFIHDSLFLEYTIKKNSQWKNGYAILKGGKRTEKICAGIPFGDTILKNQIDLWINEIIRKKEIDKWFLKY